MLPWQHHQLGQAGLVFFFLLLLLLETAQFLRLDHCMSLRGNRDTNSKGINVKVIEN
jgi:hypothetical protein